MCMTTTTYKSDEPYNPTYDNRRGQRVPREFKTLTRWKVIGLGKTKSDHFYHYSGFSRRGVWVKAQGARAAPNVTRDPNTGWHVFLTRKDARKHLARRRSVGQKGLVVVKVEVKKLVARGLGDGYRNEDLRVETYDWIRVPK